MVLLTGSKSVACTKDGVQCVFPFKFMDHMYDKCTGYSNYDNAPWCYTSRWDGGSWGNCAVCEGKRLMSWTWGTLTGSEPLSSELDIRGILRGAGLHMRGTLRGGELHMIEGHLERGWAAHEGHLERGWPEHEGHLDRGWSGLGIKGIRFDVYYCIPARRCPMRRVSWTWGAPWDGVSCTNGSSYLYTDYHV